MSARLHGIAQQTQEVVAVGAWRTFGGRTATLVEAVAAARVDQPGCGPTPHRPIG
ncbi:hypothetical protein [Streptomyces sp. NPDC001020]